MDCGVQVDAGKPTIIAEYSMKTLMFLTSKRATAQPKSSQNSRCAGMQTNGSSRSNVQRFFTARLGYAYLVLRQRQQRIADTLPFMPKNPCTWGR
jgi:hypothetical protein